MDIVANVKYSIAIPKFEHKVMDIVVKCPTSYSFNLLFHVFFKSNGNDYINPGESDQDKQIRMAKYSVMDHLKAELNEYALSMAKSRIANEKNCPEHFIEVYNLDVGI